VWLRFLPLGAPKGLVNHETCDKLPCTSWMTREQPIQKGTASSLAMSAKSSVIWNFINLEFYKPLGFYEL